MVRVLVTGGAGLLGRALVAAAPPDVEVHVTWRTAAPPGGVTAHRVDLADEAATVELLSDVRPETVIHAAYTRSALGRDVIAASRIVAEACRTSGAALVHLSTDAVFSGDDAPYFEDDDPDPICEYGRAKAKAEAIVRAVVPDAAIVRTSLLVATDPPDPRSAALVERLRDGPVELYVDELRTPMLVDDLADQLWELRMLPRKERVGPWHMAGPEVLSRYAIGLLIARYVGMDAGNVVPVESPRDVADPRPKDLRMTTWRADAALVARARPFSAAFAD